MTGPEPRKGITTKDTKSTKDEGPRKPVFQSGLGAAGALLIIGGVFLPWWKPAAIGMGAVHGSQLVSGTVAALSAIGLLFAGSYERVIGRAHGLASILLAGASAGSVVAFLPILVREIRQDLQARRTFEEFRRELGAENLLNLDAIGADAGVGTGYILALIGAFLLIIFAVSVALERRKAL